MVREEATQDTAVRSGFAGETVLLVLPPNPKEGLRGLQVFKRGQMRLSVRKSKINGKLPAPAQTPWIYPRLDVPRILLPEKTAALLKRKKYPAMGCGGSLSSGAKDARKLQGSVCLSDRKGRYAREAVLEDQKLSLV